MADNSSYSFPPPYPKIARFVSGIMPREMYHDEVQLNPHLLYLEDPDNRSDNK